MEKKIRNCLISFFCFYILFYIFNISIIGILIPDSIATAMLCLAILGLLLLGKIVKPQKRQLLFLIFCIVSVLIQLTNNHYLLEDRMGNVVKFSVCLFVPFIILTNKKALCTFMRQLKFFCVEHISATFFAQIFKRLYSSYVLPWMAHGTHLIAQDNFAQGYNPGLTSHYSTNGMYLSIATIYFFSIYLNKKEKKYFILSVLSIVALLFTAKRAHLLFTIISCLVMFLVTNKSKMSNKVISITLLLVFFVIFIQVLSIFIPQLLSVIERFEEGVSSGNLLNGRQELYELAIDIWKKNIFFGNGWGAFSFNFHYHLDYTGYGVEYMDAHNVYLQLLCECGFIGLVYFIYIASNTALKSLKILLKNKKNDNFYMAFSFGFQVFFLLYCLSGNPLYDIQCYFIYFLCIGLSWSVWFETREVKR